MKRTAHKMKRRLIICIVSILLVVVSYTILLCCIGQRYTMSILLNGTTDLSNVRVECSSDHIVRVNSIKENRNNQFINLLEVELESIGLGDVDVTVYYDDCYLNECQEGEQVESQDIVEHKDCKNAFHVTIMGLIYDRSTDRFNGLWTFELFLSVLMIILMITFSITFVEKSKSGDFTYSMVTLGGVIFFMLVTVVLLVHDFITFYDKNQIMNLWNFLYSLSNISVLFAYATTIPLILFCFLVSIFSEYQ